MYRKACDFRVDDSEAALSDKFADFDDVYFVTRNLQLSSSATTPSPIRRPSGMDELPIRRLSRRKSQVSISSERSSDGPPRSYTSPSGYPPIGPEISSGGYPSSLERQRASLSRMAGTPSGSSLPSPSYLSFTPPSGPSSLRSDVSRFFKDPPPFATTSIPLESQTDRILKDSVDISPPFAFSNIKVGVVGVL